MKTYEVIALLLSFADIVVAFLKNRKKLRKFFRKVITAIASKR